MLDSILNIVTPAPDRSLLTIEELRAAADIPDKSEDAGLRKLGAQTSARITRACRVKAGGATPPTLREETVLETFRDRHRHHSHHWRQRLRLARRPIVSITSMTFDGVSQDISALLIDADAGMVEFHANRGSFHGIEIAFQYVAGWANVPEDLALAASLLAQQYLAASDQPPGLRMINIPNVVERQYWVGQQSDPDVPQSILDMLSPYMNLD